MSNLFSSSYRSYLKSPVIHPSIKPSMRILSFCTARASCTVCASVRLYSSTHAPFGSCSLGLVCESSHGVACHPLPVASQWPIADHAPRRFPSRIVLQNETSCYGRYYVTNRSLGALESFTLNRPRKFRFRSIAIEISHISMTSVRYASDLLMILFIIITSVNPYEVLHHPILCLSSALLKISAALVV